MEPAIITFINSGLAEVPFHALLARELAKLGYSVHAVTMGSRYTRAYRKAGCFAQVHDLVEWMRDHWSSVSDVVACAKQIEDKYCPEGLWRLLGADRRLCRFDHEFNLRVACVQTLFWERHFDVSRPKLLVGEISHFHNYLPWAIGRVFQVPFAHILSARIPGHTAIGDGPYEHRDIVRRNFELFKQRGVPDELRAKAEAYVTSFREKTERATHLTPLRKWYEDPADIGSLRGFLETSCAWFGWERKYNYTLLPPGEKIRNWLTIKYRRAAMVAGRYFEPVSVCHEPFVLFGLHYQPEASTLVRGQFFQNMLALVQNISLSLPVGYRLLVKEHDVMFGQRSLSFFRELRKMPNVVSVSPYESGPILVRKAAAVVTVTGTFGWDGVLLGKPVIAFGESFFAEYSGVDHVTDLTRVPDILRERLRGFTPNHEELITFVAAVFASIVPAGIDDLWGLRSQMIQTSAPVIAQELARRASNPTPS